MGYIVGWQAFFTAITHIIFMSNFAERLKELLFDKNITNKQLAKDLGVSLWTVQRWQSREVEIRLSYLFALAKYLRCSLDFLVGLSNNDSKPAHKEKLPKFSTRIREIMKTKNISTYTLRKNLDIGNRYFQTWDRGSDPKLSTLLELANYFNCSLDDLVGLE